ncbi:MAG: glycoside hydrolase family 2 protein, partial [Acidobacteriota bacterium]|nr:glycoside hydrolase family 2 protein [Acidobacteriota bacterium]
MKNLYLILSLILLFAVNSAAQQLPVAARAQISLNDNWRFREAGKGDWKPATVPGCVHTDLLANKLIEDPFYRDNEKKLQWIGKTDWEYETAFVVSPEIL